MGGHHYPLAVRREAVEAWAAAGKPEPGSMAEAVRIFRQNVPADCLPKNPSEFVATWVRNWQEHSSVRSPSPAPRESAISDDVAKECVQKLKAGYMCKGQRKYYRSLREAVKFNPFIKSVMESYKTPDTGKNLTTCTLWRHLKRVDPTLTRRTLCFAFKLTASHKTARVAYCQRLLAMSPTLRNQYLARVVWIDSKKLFVVPEGRLVYAPAGANMLVQDQRIPDSFSKLKRIVYYAAVNASIGPVFWSPVTGTTPDKVNGKLTYPSGDTRYMASGSESYERVRCKNQQWGFSFTCCTACSSSLAHCVSSA